MSQRSPTRTGGPCDSMTRPTARLIVPIIFIVALGWIPVIAVVFALGARAFGSRRILLDLALGLAFGIVTFLIFNYALGRNLPSGWIMTRLFG